MAAAAQTSSFTPPPAVSPELQAKFESFLKDPASAQIKVDTDKEVSIEGSPEHVTCGRYNAKNSYGGYVGFKDFVYRSSNRSLYTDDAIVRQSGVDSLEEIMTHNPSTRAELDALSAKGDAIIAEVQRAFALCKS